MNYEISFDILKYCQKSWSSRYSPLLSSRKFIVLLFILSLWSTWIDFCEMSSLCGFFCIWICNHFSTICCKDGFYLHKMFLLLCQGLFVYAYMCLFIGSKFCSIDWCFHSLINITYCNFIVNLEVDEHQSSDFILLYYCVVYSWSFAFPYKP